MPFRGSRVMDDGCLLFVRCNCTVFRSQSVKLLKSLERFTTLDCLYHGQIIELF